MQLLDFMSSTLLQTLLLNLLHFPVLAMDTSQAPLLFTKQISTELFFKESSSVGIGVIIWVRVCVFNQKKW